MDAPRLIGLFLGLSAITAHCAVLDLRSISPAGSSFVGVIDGIQVKLSGSGGTLVSTSTGFGIDRDGLGDIPNQIDGGTGTAERLAILFGQNVFVDSIAVSYFGSNDQGSVSIKGYGDITLHDGLNEFSGLVAGRTSANYISWTGSNASDPELGFSIDTITFRAVPEPSLGILLAPGFALLFVGRRRRTPSSELNQAEQGVAPQPAARSESDFSGSLPPST